jgi:hypothetical protein
MGKFVVEQTLTTETCVSCGIVFAMPEEYNRLLRNDYRGTAEAWFYCPRGHQQYYSGASEADKLRQQLDEERRQRQRAEQKIAQKDDEIRDWKATANDQRDKAEHERRRANGYKGHATRITKRAKAGVCPCCNRSFQQLARHMATKHPTFTPLEVIEGGKADAA